MEIGDPIDVVPGHQPGQDVVAHLGSDGFTDQESAVSINQEHRDHGQEHPTRMEPMASGIGEPVSWWSPMPDTAITMPIRAAASSGPLPLLHVVLDPSVTFSRLTTRFLADSGDG